MIRIMERSGERTIGLDCDGTISLSRFNEVLPVIEKAVERHGTINMLFVIKNIRGYGFREFAADVSFCLRHWNDIERLAVVSNRDWWKAATSVENLLTPWEERYFDLHELDSAWRWIEGEDG